MIAAMGAITTLGFLVWAQLGLCVRECTVIKLRYMLENTPDLNSKLTSKVNNMGP